jgi:Protein of unknown function (DUF1688)
MGGVAEAVRADKAALGLLTAQAVRERAHRMLALGLEGRLANFRVDLERLSDTADRVIAITRASYPTLDVPLHARWRHFVAAGADRWASLDRAQNWQNSAERARAMCDLAIVSVLLDAGAGPEWHYRDPRTGEAFVRSEGLALASLDMFAAGAFSSRPDEPLRVDAAALHRLSAETLSAGFQVSAANPLLGLEGRAQLLRRLGDVVAAAPEVFGRSDVPRPGGLFDHFAAGALDGSVAAPQILSALLIHLGGVWPTRTSLGGVPLGDCWRYPGLKLGPPVDDLVPLHKLSQWLTYSLIEPLQAGGVIVTDIDGLTGLAEYRNGGLFVDADVLVLRDPADAERVHEVGSPLVVEWRALTVALLDRLAVIVRERLGLDAVSFPLAKLLEGGTWAAGRAIARERRPGGGPPIGVISDGTVF